MKKFLALVLAAIMILSIIPMAAAESTDSVGVFEADGYTYGEKFWSDEPVTYTIFFSDASWYPMVDTWKTEGVFEQIRKATNVTLDLISYDSNDYTTQVGLDLGTDRCAYIIPKIYDESGFVDGGAILPVSDYVEYMPNFTWFYNTYNLKADVDTILRADNKFYRLPGMHEAALQDYTLMVRDDIFATTGYDVKELENTCTSDDCCDILIGVKKYMVAQGMCAEDAYIWSDLWCGQSGQGSGGYLCKLVGNSYDVASGWAVGNGLRFDFDKDEWYLSSTSENFKKFVTVMHRFVAEGILDPETFVQDDSVANDKFYTGKSVVQGFNRSQLVTWMTGLNEGLGEGNYSVYITVYPAGTNNYVAENTRLENGVCISKGALEDLGEEGFIKMMRFVDWMFYSDAGYILTKWGPEGETWEYVEEDGMKIKKLLPGFKCGGLGIAGSDDDVDIRLKWGYACGNYFYAHSNALRGDNLPAVVQDYDARYAAYRDQMPLSPATVLTPEEIESTSLIQADLIANINAWTIQFITGQKDIEADWDAYVQSCEEYEAEELVKTYNEAYARTKGE